MNGFSDKDTDAIHQLLESAAQEAYEEYGNNEEEVLAYMENILDDVAHTLSLLAPSALAMYRARNDPSERGL